MDYATAPATESETDSLIFDLREVPCSEQHGLIFSRWHDLDVGDSFVLVNGDPPTPLQEHFSQEFPDCFEWDVLVSSEGFNVVKVTRLQPDPQGDNPGK